MRFRDLICRGFLGDPLVASVRLGGRRGRGPVPIWSGGWAGNTALGQLCHDGLVKGSGERLLRRFQSLPELHVGCLIEQLWRAWIHWILCET